MATTHRRIYIQGQALVDIPPNYHYDCLLAYPERYHKPLDAFFVQVTTMPRVSVLRWLQAAHRARIVSSFSELGELHDCKSLRFTLEEIIEGHWVRPQAGKLHQLEKAGSPYERHIHAIAGFKNCPKIRTLGLVLKHIWRKDAKVVIMTISPVSALIVYWVSRPLFPGVGAELFANADHRLFASYGRSLLP